MKKEGSRQCKRHTSKTKYRGIQKKNSYYDLGSDHMSLMSMMPCKCNNETSQQMNNFPYLMYLEIILDLNIKKKNLTKIDHLRLWEDSSLR